MLINLVKRLEQLVFGYRLTLLVVVAVVTAVMGYYATQLRMSPGFDKQLPQQHEFIKTFNQYRDVLFGSNRIVVVLHKKDGDIWNAPALTKLYDITQAVFFMPGVDRRGVTSLWTPNTRAVQITEEGMKAEDVIGGDVTVKTLTPEAIVGIRERTIIGGFVGSLVANDGSGAMVVAELVDPDPVTGKPLDYVELDHRLETELRAKFSDAEFDVQIIGFAKQMGDIIAGAAGVVKFFALAFVLTALAVYWYTRSIMLTVLPLVCSLVSVVWQFGTITLLGFGLDPLAVLVPFLVFAIGVSHGVQQINSVSMEVCAGHDAMTAAKRSFSGLLIPGTLALVTAFVGFATLVMVPIPMIRELAITASVGVAYKIVTNLIMLPVVASYVKLPADYGARMARIRERRSLAVVALARLAEPGPARIIVVASAVLFGLAVWAGRDRHVGYVQPGAPELRDSARYNRDAVGIAEKFSVGLDVLTVVNETAPDSCYEFAKMRFIDDLAWELQNTEGVIGTASLPALVKLGAAGFNEGHPRWGDMPRDKRSMASFIGLVGEGSGLYDPRCTVLPVNVYLTDHKAETIQRVVGVVRQFRESHRLEGVKVRLASGNAGVQAATNEVLAATELPMMLYVYATIVVLVFLTYRDWRAVIACCLPLTLATFIGYAFMKALDIGLTVATLPVMVLAVGIGVDYAFYIYNRLQLYLADGLDIVSAFRRALAETGIATVFTALTLSVGVATWVFSPLKFQADMGLLLAFMFMLNMLMAITVLPALAVTLDTMLPRRGPVHRPFMAH